MKRLLSLLVSLSIAAQGLTSFLPAFAAGKAEKFEITLTQTAKVGEAVDIGVKVIGKDGQTVTDYLGTVYVTVDNDSKATVPYPEGYTFVASDNGEKVFSKGLSFSKEGSMKVSVIDLDDDKVEGVAKINISAADSTSQGGETVTILSPDNGSSISSNETKVSGTTKKNSKVQVFVNGTKSAEVQSDDTGAFVADVKGLSEENNVISAKVLDGTDKVVGESTKVTVKVASEGPAFKNIAIQEGNTIPVGKVAHVSVTADAGLKEVSVSLGDSIEVLKEGTAGVYSGTVTVPAKTGDYQVDVTLTNELGKKTVKSAAAKITAQEAPKASFQNIKTQVSEKKVTFTFEVNNDSASVAKFKIKYGAESGSLTKESVTFDKAKIVTKTDSGSGVVSMTPPGAAAAGSGMKDSAMNGSGALPPPSSASGSKSAPVAPIATDSGSVSITPSYTWYVDGLTEPKYAFQVVALDAAGSEIAGTESDVIDVDMSMNAAGKCMISDISGVKITKKDDSSIITWDAIPSATGYNVYKKDATGKYTLIENVKTNSYTLHIAKGDVKYEDFAIKAVCSDNATESANYADASKVQTGPGKFILLGILALGIGFVISRRKFAFLKK